MTAVLVIKTSSMGDIIHTLPALTDAAKCRSNIFFDWVVEEAFAEIPRWHPLVRRIIPIALRRFKKQPLKMIFNGELKNFYQQLRVDHYDYVIDAQGLMKSAVITRLARGLRCGLNSKSAWEPIATLAYQRKVAVNPKQHAIWRMRQLFSQALDYPLIETMPDYGLKIETSHGLSKNKKYLVFIHSTTWETKEWPESYWMKLADIAQEYHYDVLLPWGNAKEQQRAIRIAQPFEHVTVLPSCSLTQIASILLSAVGIVSVDTGLGHLAAALNMPTVSIYGPTDPKKVGTQGYNQRHISVNFQCAPCWSQKCGYGQITEVTPACYFSITPSMVWEQLEKVISA